MKSLFLLPGTSKKAMESQGRRIAELRRMGDGPDTPFHDGSGAVRGLCGFLGQRQGNIFASVIANLAPQNTDVYERSALGVPFVLDPNGEGIFAADMDGGVRVSKLRTAGFVASIKPAPDEGRMVRLADLFDITVLAAAVFRRAGQDAMFSFIHELAPGGDGEARKYVPAITLPGAPEAQHLRMVPPFLAKGQGLENMAIEVLGDDALLSLMKMRMAAMEYSMLSESIRLEGILEGELDAGAAAIGHMLFEAGALWSGDDAAGDMLAGQRHFGTEWKGKIASVRLELERSIRHQMFPDESSLEEIFGRLALAEAKGKISAEQGESALVSISAAVAIGERILRHVHDGKECGLLVGAAGN